MLKEFHLKAHHWGAQRICRLFHSPGSHCRRIDPPFPPYHKMVIWASWNVSETVAEVEMQATEQRSLISHMVLARPLPCEPSEFTSPLSSAFSRLRIFVSAIWMHHSSLNMPQLYVAAFTPISALLY